MRKLSLLIIVGAVLALSAGIAAAAAGSLTAFEYQQLVYTRGKLKTASGISAAIFDCEQIQMQTKLRRRVPDSRAGDRPRPRAALQNLRDVRAGNLTKFESYTRTVVVGSADISKGQQANSGPPSICPHPGSEKGSGKPSV